MTQSDDNNRTPGQPGPDNARNFDDVDVPTYRPQAGSPLDRPGRAEPETISFNSHTPAAPAGGADATFAASTPAPGTAAADDATRAFTATSGTDTFGGAAAAATPNSGAYADQDFAPAADFGAGAAGAGAGAVGVAEPTAVEAAPEGPTPEEERAAARRQLREERKTDPRRGTLDFGLLLVRLALSAWLIVAGLSTFFGWGGSDGLAGLEAEFGAYALPQVLAIVVPTLQLLAGAFLLLGLVTPFAAMIALVVTGFSGLHALIEAGGGLNPFYWPEAIWLYVILFVLAVGLQFTGPGVVSLDFGRSWARRPLASSWVFIVLGIAALVAAWWFGAGVNPVA